MSPTTQTTNGSNGETAEALKTLVKAGLELGVAEAVRRLSMLTPTGRERPDEVEVDAVLTGAAVTELVDAIRQDPTGVFQLVKEVWSRGGTKDRTTAARALGHGLSRIAPHKALGLSRDLATMARSSKEADLIGAEAIGPLLEANPPFFDRVKQFLKDNEPMVRRAAIAGLVWYVGRNRRYAATALQAILLIAEQNEKEIKTGIRWAVREASKVDWRGTAQAIAEWAESDPARLKPAKQYAAATAESTRANVERFVILRLAKFVDGEKKTRAR